MNDLETMNQTASNIGGLVGAFIGFGVAIAFGAGIIRYLLVRLNWPKSYIWRTLISCFSMVLLILLIAPINGTEVILVLFAGGIVFAGYLINKPKPESSKKVNNTEQSRSDESIETIAPDEIKITQHFGGIKTIEQIQKVKVQKPESICLSCKKPLPEGHVGTCSKCGSK